MSKFILFCADGTWNGPDKDDNDIPQSDPTNVYKLFSGLKGEVLNTASINQADEQEKVLQEAGTVRQVAKYIHGVGDFDNPIKKMMGGAFGAGTIARIVRGYTFISRNYDPGDPIIVVGFSRGAYTARALAGMIAYQGLLSKALTQDKTEAYRWGVRAWFRYRSESKKHGFLQKLEKAAIDIVDVVYDTELSDSQLQPVGKIKAVAVWDTVGALGQPLYIKDNRVDVFKFTDNQLSVKVERVFMPWRSMKSAKTFPRHSGIVPQTWCKWCFPVRMAMWEADTPHKTKKADYRTSLWYEWSNNWKIWASSSTIRFLTRWLQTLPERAINLGFIHRLMLV